MKLSIIIPVHHAESTLESCVDSILQQGISEAELILIDDGSDVHCAELCDALSSGNDMVYAYHQKNSGYSASRNKGIELSTGDYIMFIDSDAKLAPYTLPILLARLGAHPDYDILEFPILWHSGSENEYLEKFGRREYTNMREYWIDGRAYAHSYACNKIFRRSLFEEEVFPIDITYADAFILPRLLSHCHVVATTEEGAYQYPTNHIGDGSRLTELLDVHVGMVSQYGLIDTPSVYYADVLNIQLDVYDLMKETPILPVPSTLNRRTISKLPISRKNKMKLRLLRMLGIYRLCKLHRLRHRLRRSH
ncbi:MAG: glycosyltransferase family 2 protein [Prevotella sp.]|nr:glycosyltransferase family 2 protein [Prevotella sp.]